MIVTVTLNPALDYFLPVESWQAGAIHRAAQGRFAPGGKGINVSLLLASLGAQTLATGVAAGFTGKELLRLLEEWGCPADFVWDPRGATRMNLKLRASGGEETDFNAAGGPVAPQAVDQLLEKLGALGPGDCLALSGSLPPGLPGATLPRLLEGARRSGAELVADLAGDALLAALPYRPFLIKPNEEELRALFPLEGALSPLEAKACAQELQRMGARNVAVTLGAKGALLLEEGGRCLYCHGVRGQAVSTVGAGDSFVAGFLYGWKLHGTPQGALKWAAAAGAATAFREGIATGDEVKALYPQVGEPHAL